MIKLTITGNPMGKQRARTTRQGFAYTPKNTVNYETLVKELFIIKYPDHRLLEGPVILKIDAYYPIPKSASIKKKELMSRGEIRPTVRPDFDNVIKIFADALSTLAYKDDSQVVGSEFRKYYDETPRCEIVIYELSEGAEEDIANCGRKIII